MVMKGQRTSVSSALPSQQQGSGGSTATLAEAGPSDALTKEQRLKKYEELKEKGNACVKKVHVIERIRKMKMFILVGKIF